jgi:transmembrane sensor
VVGQGERRHDQQDDWDASESMSDEAPWERLVRYGAGDATPDDLAALASWQKERAEHAQLMRRVVRLAALSRTADSLRHADAGWERLQHRLELARASEGEARVLPVRRRPFEATAPSARGGVAWRGRAVAGLAAGALIAVGLVAWHLRPVSPLPMREVATHRGERLDLGLPDGSHVVLGAESRLRYSAKDFAAARTLYLEGQGFFAVSHDPKHPFVVHARGATAQAVGTAFGVRAYDDDSTVDVAVAVGRVLMRAKSSAPGADAMLDVGDLGQIDEAGRVTVRRGANLDSYLGWVRGRLIYDMAPAASVVRDLERWYDVSIQIDSAAQRSDLRVSITIDPTQPAPVSLERFAEVLRLHVISSGKMVELVRDTLPRRASGAHLP